MRLAAALVVCLIVAPGARAATLVAAPDGKGTACTAQAPCQLQTAITNAATGNSIQVRPGGYQLSGAENLASGVDIAGDDPRPTISLFNGTLNLYHGSAQNLDVDVMTDATAAIAIDGASTTLDHVVAHSINSVACVVKQGGVVESVCRSDTGEGVRISGGGSPTLQSVTALGGSAAVHVLTDASPTTLVMNSVIARATSGSDVAIDLPTGGTTSASAKAYHCNFRAGPDSGIHQNQSADPQFADHWHQAAGSPTIDAGDADALQPGETDIDGQPRGTKPDIGADEFVAPVATTGGADAITQTQATLHGTVDGKGPSGTASFEYGTTSGYGSVIAAPGSGDVQAGPAGLTPGTTYHYRVRFQVGPSIVTGADATFTTAARPGRNAVAVAHADPVSTALDTKKPTVKVTVTGKRRRGKRVRLTVAATDASGIKSVAIKVGHRRSVAKRSVRIRLPKRRHRTVTVVVTVVDTAGNARTVVRVLP